MISAFEIFNTYDITRFITEEFKKLDNEFDTLYKEMYLESDEVSSFDDLSSFIFCEGRKDVKTEMDNNTVTKESSSTIFGSIGRLVKSILQAISSIFEKFTSSIEKISFRSKSDVEKLDQLCKNNPEYDKMMRDAFAAGVFRLSDIKSYNEGMAQLKQLEREIEKNSEPKTFKQKIDSIIDGFNDNRYVKAVITAGSLAKAGISLIDFSKKCKDSLEASQESRFKHEQTVNKIYKELEEKAKNDPEAKEKLTGKYVCKLNLEKARLEMEGKALGIISKSIQHVQMTGAKILDKVTSQNKIDKFHEEHHNYKGDPRKEYKNVIDDNNKYGKNGRNTSEPTSKPTKPNKPPKPPKTPKKPKNNKPPKYF